MQELSVVMSGFDPYEDIINITVIEADIISINV